MIITPPTLTGYVFIDKLQPFSSEVVGAKVVSKMNINGIERINGEFTYPIYQDETNLIGEASTTNLGVVEDHIIIRIELFINDINKATVNPKNNRINLVVNCDNGKLYQSGKDSNGYNLINEIGTCSYEYTKDYEKNYAQKNKAEYRDDNLPYSVFV
jgi:hypothetical protein